MWIYHIETTDCAARRPGDCGTLDRVFAGDEIRGIANFYQLHGSTLFYTWYGLRIEVGSRTRHKTIPTRMYDYSEMLFETSST